MQIKSFYQTVKRFFILDASVEPQQRRAKILSAVLLVTLIAMFLLTMQNVLEFLIFRPTGYAIFLVQDLGGLIFLVVLAELNRQGHTRVVGSIYVISIVVGATLLFPTESLDKVMVIYAIPIFISSFLVHPSSAFGISLFAMLNYTVAKGGFDVSDRYSYVGMLTLGIFAVVAWMISSLLDQAFDLARESIADLRSIMHDVGEGIARLDTETRFVFANPMASQILGITQNEMLNRKLKEFIVPEHQTILEQQLVLRQQGKRSSYEIDIVRGDGVRRTLLMTATPQYDPSGKFIGSLGTMRDVTEQKEPERILRRYEALSDNARDIVLYVRSNDGGIVEANYAATRAYGYTREELLTKSIFDLRPQDGKPFVNSQMQQANRQGILFETVHIRRDGTPFPVEVSSRGVEIGDGRLLLSIIRDITERKRAEHNRELLAQTARDLSSSLNLQDIYTTLYKGIKQAMPCASMLVSQYDSSEQLIRCAFGYDNGPMDVSQFPPISLEAQGRGTQSLVIRSGQPLILNDYETQIKTAQTLYHITDGPTLAEEIPDDEERPRSAIIVPIKLDNQVAGVIQVFSLQRNDYLPEHLQFLESLALYVSTAMANAHLYAQVQNELNERKRTEDALRENEVMFRGFIDQSSEGISLVDSQGVVIEWNSAFENITGILRKDTLGNYAWDVQSRLLAPQLQNEIVKNSLKEMMLKALDSLTITSLKSTEGVIYTTRGETKTVLQSLFPIVAPTGNYLGILLRDVTERKHAEQSIAANERRMRALVENIGDGIELVDAKGTVIYASPSVARMLGITQEQILGASVSEMHPDDRASAEATMMQVMSSPGTPINQSYRLRHADGTWHWFEGTATNLLHDPAIEAIVINFRNVTERKRTEDALRASEEQFRILFENVGEGIARVTAPGNFILTNPALEKIFGVQPHGLLGHNITEFIPSDQRDKHRDQVEQRKQGIINSYELQIVRPDGNRRTVIITSTPWFDNAGNYGGAFGVLRDITEAKRTEEALRESEGLYRTLIETLDVSLCRWLPDTTLVYANERYRQIFGIQGQAIGRKWLDYLPNETREETVAFYRELIANPRSVSYEHPVIVENGSLRHYQWIDSPIRNSEGEVTEFQSVGIDITPRKLAEEEARESRARVEMALQGANLAMWDWYIQTGKTVFNERWAEMLGYTLAELEPCDIQTWINLSHPDDLLKSNELLQKHFNGQTEFYECEVRMRHKSGAWIWVADRGKVVERDANGAPIRMTGTHMDITERKRSEEELRESEDRYRRAIIAADAIPYVRDYNNERYVFIGSGIEKLTGYVNYEFTPRVLDSLVIESIMQGDLKGYMPKEAAQIVRQGNIGVTWKCDHRIRTRNGGECWLSDSSIQIVDERGVPTGSIGIIQDITERKETERILEERIRQRTAEVQDLYNNAPAGYHSLDADGKFILINQTELNWLGYSREEVIGRSFTDLIVSAGRAKFIEQFTKLKQNGSVKNLEYEYVRKDGSTFPVLVGATAIYDDAGNYLMSRSTVFDNTERKKAENALRESEEQNRLLFEQAPDPTVLVDGMGRVVRMNHAYEFFTGVPSDKFMGHTAYEVGLLPQDQSSQLDTEITQALKLDSNFVVTESKFKRADGETRDMNMRLFSLTIEGHQHFLITFHDVTAEKRTEETLRLANTEMERALRMKDEFLANMSHELRTPLNAILGLSESLIEQFIGPLNERQLSSLQTIEASGRHLLSLINDILDLSKIESGNEKLDIQPVAVKPLCEASLIFIKQVAHKKKIKLSSSIDLAVDWIAADERRLKQMLINLLTNAVKFTPSGGKVELHVIGDVEDKTVSFAIHDTGIGIAPEDIDRLFQPFVQLDSGLTRVHEGTGLGLALVSRMCEMHGGHVHVESEVGKGSCFTMVLPWSNEMQTFTTEGLSSFDEPAQPIANTISSTVPIHADSPLILIVEDNETNANTLSMYLNAKGYRISNAQNGMQGLEMARAEHPTLVVMDLQMPVMDGLEAMRRLRSEPDATLANVPIIALTALAMPQDRERSIAAGANDYMTKPVNLRQLIEKIEQLVRR
jgi:PAS domain S-box-containing protein